MLRLILVRHGETDWNKEQRYLGHTDLALNETGIRQAKAAARFLQQEKLDAIFTSGLQRAYQTAAEVASLHSLEPQVDDRLQELSMGVFEGLTFNQVKEKFPEMLDLWLADYDQPPRGGEGLSSLSERVAGFLDTARKLDSCERIAVVSHGGPLREITRQLLGMPQPKHWYFSFSPGSISEIQLYSSGPVIGYLNLKPKLLNR